MAYVPHHRRISDWFKANPHEWLTLDDICAKFDVSKHMARTALAELNAGTRVVEHVGVYRLISNEVSNVVSAEVSKA